MPAGMLTFVEVVTWKNVMDSGFPREESHERWANYFFPKIWNNSDLPEKEIIPIIGQADYL